MRVLLFATFLLASAGIVPTAHAQSDALRLPALFDDDMIVQRGEPVRVWGWAPPGSTVQATMNGAAEKTTADADSTWIIELPALEAGGPHVLEITGSDTLTFQNVLVGDLWIAGGQSNMEWPLSLTTNGAQELRRAQYPHIRLFTVERGFADEPGGDVRTSGWHETTPETIGDFSAVAYFFGRKLHEELDIPIGLLESNWGGSAAEAWMTPAGLAEVRGFEAIADSLGAGTSSATTIHGRSSRVYERRMREWANAARRLDPGFEGPRAVWAQPDFPAENWDTMRLPAAWEDAGLQGYDGVVWLRTSFDVPDAWKGKALQLSLPFVDDVDSTWINGRLVGNSHWSGPRTYRIAPELVTPSGNALVVRVIDLGGQGGIRGDAEALHLRPVDGGERDVVSLAGPWHYRRGVELAQLPPFSRPPQENQIPTGLYNAMIAPITNLPVKGVIWYQGETNAGRAYQYRELFPKLIEDWREQFEQSDMPFLFVQLANFMDVQEDPGEESAWAELREAQTMTLSVPHTAMAVTIDIGEAHDIHPRNKLDVGERLARAALAKTYGRNVVYSGPQFVGVRRDGKTMRVLFDHVGSGLVAKGGDLRGFTIAGPDGRFVWADARIEDNMVVVSSPQVDDPRAVRYAWANNPRANLYNVEGLPAIPFRTDDLPGVTISSY